MTVTIELLRDTIRSENGDIEKAVKAWDGILEDGIKTVFKPAPGYHLYYASFEGSDIATRIKIGIEYEISDPTSEEYEDVDVFMWYVEAPDLNFTIPRVRPSIWEKDD